MPLAATAYNTNIDSSGIYTAPETGIYQIGSGGTGWNNSITGATTGTIYYNTTSSSTSIFNGDLSTGSTGGWVTLGNGGTLTVSGNIMNGDTATLGYTVSGGSISSSYIYVDSEEQKQERMKRQLQQIMKSNLIIKFGSTRQNSLRNKVADQEIKARNTLRDLITEKEWRGYLTNGFVIIKSESGKFYQVFNDQRHIKVYQKGKLTDEICIHTDANECPPTDHILNMMVLIQNDEQIIWTKGVGNVYNKNVTDPNVLNGLAVHGNIALASSGYMEHLSIDTNRKLNLSETYKRLKVA